MEIADSLSEIDSVDRQILSRLDHNSRQSIADLARGLKLGRDRVAYRLNRLEQRGVLRACTTNINPYKFGVIIYKTYMQLETNKPRVKQFMKYLMSHPRIYWVAECDGKWDLMIATFARNPKEFHTIQDEILTQYNDIVINFSVYTLIDVWCFRKRWFLGHGSENFFFGGVPDSYALDELDFNLLRVLSDNARIALKELSEQVSATPAIVSHRIKRMQQVGIIIGYRTELDLSKIGMTFFKTQLYLSTFDPRIEERIYDYCTRHPNIATFIKQIGDCKVELELEVRDYNQLNRIMDDLRQRFPRLIRTIEIVLIRSQHFRWVPFDMARTDERAA